MGTSNGFLGGSNVQLGLPPSDRTQPQRFIPRASDWVNSGHVTYLWTMKHSGKSSETPLRKLSLLLRKQHRREAVLPLDIVVSGCDSMSRPVQKKSHPQMAEQGDGKYPNLDLILQPRLNQP